MLYDKVRGDQRRAHDPLVLQWMVTSLSYERLLTDFGRPLQTSVLAQSTILPPRERVDFNETKDKWTNFWKWTLAWHDMFVIFGNKICMVAL